LDKERGSNIYDRIDWLYNGLYHKPVAGTLLPPVFFDGKTQTQNGPFVAAHCQYFIFSHSNPVHTLFK